MMSLHTLSTSKSLRQSNMKNLIDFGLDDKDIRLIINVYAEQKVTIRLENESSPELYASRLCK